MKRRPRTPNQRPLTSSRSPSASSMRSSSKATPLVPVDAGSTASAMRGSKLPPWRAGRGHATALAAAERARSAVAQPRRARFLARACVAVECPALDRLVDRLDELAVLGVRLRSIAIGDGVLEPAEERLDLGGIAAVLQALALGAHDPLLL